MTIEEYWDDCTSQEKENFQRVIRYLLKKTFVVRDRDDNGASRKMFSFISHKLSFITDYLKYMGFEVALDRDNGVAMLRSIDGGDVMTGHLRLKRIDSIILCALWTMYSDRLREGSLVRNFSVSLTDLSFALEKFGYRDSIDKTTLSNALSLLSSYNLVSVKGKVGEPECIIVLYPSLQFALSKEGFEDLAKASEERMRTKNRRETFEELSEEDMEESDGD